MKRIPIFSLIGILALASVFLGHPQTAELQDYSTTAGSNNSASPAGWPEGMAPSGVNNSDRELAARIARERDDTQGVTATGGSGGAYTFAATRDTTAAYTGELITFRANHTNTATATINITPSGGSARGAVAINAYGAALRGGEIVNGGVYTVVYDGTNWELVNPGKQTHAFLVVMAADRTNVTGAGTAYTVVLDTEVFDDGANFASNTFTAPVTGRYQFNALVHMYGLTTGLTTIDVSLVASNRTMQLFHFQNDGGIVEEQMAVGGSVLVDMDNADTATLRVTVSGGTDVVDLSSANETHFSGFLAP